MGKPTITWRNGWQHDCDDTTGWAETEAGLDATLTSDGDIFTIEGTCDNVADELVKYELDITNISTTIYPTLVVKWRTSAASNGLQAKVKVVYTDVSVDWYTLGYSTLWKVTTCTLDTAKTLDKVCIYADDEPDTIAAGTFQVYYDWLMVCSGIFTFPHVAPGGIKANYPMKKAVLKPPGREGSIIQRFGLDTPKITLKGDVLQGETWEKSSSDPHFDYLLRSLLYDDWAWFHCDYPRISAQVVYDDFTTAMETRDDKAALTWQLDLLLHKLGDFNDFADWGWMYTA